MTVSINALRMFSHPRTAQLALSSTQPSTPSSASSKSTKRAWPASARVELRKPRAMDARDG